MVSRGARAMLGAVLLAAGPPALAADGAPPLRPGEARSLSGEPGAATLVPLSAGAGVYVAGTLEVSAGRVRLDLLTPGGSARRRLGDEVAGRLGFRFVTDAPGEALRVTPGEAARFTLRLDRQLAPDEQVAPAPAFLSPRMAQLAQALSRGEGTEAFWQEMAERGTPLVEPAAEPGQVIATFLQRGARRNVRLFGAPSGDHEALERLGSSDVWFKSFSIPDTTRLSYQLAPDVPDLPGTARERRVAILATAQVDPLNRHPWPADAPDVFNQDSVLELPGAPAQPGMEAGEAPAGTLSTWQMASARLGNRRAVTLYSSPGFQVDDPRARLLVLFDREPYLEQVPTPRILDHLVASGRIPPIAAVLVSSIEQETRGRELPDNPSFADFLAEALLPEVRQRLGGAIPAERTILAGSSYGGLAAATVALRHPESFGNVLALSGSFWWRPPGEGLGEGQGEGASEGEGSNLVASRLARTPRLPIRFHLTAGLFERAHADAAGILETTRHVHDVLRAKGYAVSLRTYAGGHDFLVWRGAMADGLIALTHEPPSP